MESTTHCARHGLPLVSQDEHRHLVAHCIRLFMKHNSPPTRCLFCGVLLALARPRPVEGGHSSKEADSLLPREPAFCTNCGTRHATMWCPGNTPPWWLWVFWGLLVGVPLLLCLMD